MVFLCDVCVLGGGILQVPEDACTYGRAVGHENVRLGRDSTEPGLSGRRVLEARG